MDPRRGEKDIFLKAVEFSSLEERAVYVTQACAGDEQLRAGVAALLAAHFRGHEILDASASASESPGTIIGPYRIVEQIGEGGMGIVYLAEQLQPVQRRVALKIIKPGMDSSQVITRFQAEKQALALMDHQHIARVLDAGTTEQGRPYFVMELVDGEPITKYCDDQHLTPRQRLELFVPVCQAIQHAHQKGIIHRDIKPSNVLVALQEGKPIPKVIDFGVAKAIEVKLTEQTLFTHHGMLIGTLEYMSPEQADPGAGGVDTRSDIYSLGVLLYELLAGSTPLDRQRVRQAAYGEILRLIKEEDPPQPSTRLRQSGESLPSISALRQMDPARLTRLLRGELDWIVMKSLEKDRARRYAAASDLAADIQRFLNDEPVEAGPPSRAYRLRKFVRRNRLAIGTAALVATSLLAGIVVASWQAARATAAATRAAAAEGLATSRLNEANEARQKQAELLQEAQKRQAEAEVARDRAVSNWRRSVATLNELHDLLGSHELPREFSMAVTALERKLLEELVDINAAPSHLKLELAVATLNHSAWYSGAERTKLVESALALARDVYKSLPRERRAQTTYLTALLFRAGCELPPQADPATEAANLNSLLDQCRHIIATDEQAADAHTSLAQLMLLKTQKERGQAAEAGRAEWLKEVMNHSDDVPSNPNFARVQVHNLRAAGAMYYDRGLLMEAESAWRKGLKLAEAWPLVEQVRSSPPEAISMCEKLVPLLCACQRTQEAREVLHNSRKNLDAIVAMNPPARNRGNYGSWILRFVSLMEMAGELEGIEELEDRAWQIANEEYTRRIRGLPANVIPRAHELAFWRSQRRCKLGEIEDAERIARLGWQAAEVHIFTRGGEREQVHLPRGPRNPTVNRQDVTNVRSQLLLCRLFAEQDRVKEAAARPMRDRILTGNATSTSPAFGLFADELGTEMEWATMDNQLAWSLATWRDARRQDPAVAVRLASRIVEKFPDQAAFWNTLGVARYRAAQYDDAIVALNKSVELGRGSAEDWLFLAMAYHQFGNQDEASKQYDLAVAWIEKHRVQDEELLRFRQEAIELLGISKTSDETAEE